MKIPMEEVDVIIESDFSELCKFIRQVSKEKKALWHPLGFVSCTLLEGDNWALKLHYWPSGERRPKKPNWPIHDHVFHIKSRVLLGEIKDVRYDLSSCGDSVLYKVDYSDKDSSLIPCRYGVSVNRASYNSYVSGDIYHIPLGDFHEALVPLEAEVATIVLKHGYDKSEPYVIGREGCKAETYYREEYKEFDINKIV